ncbi:DUF3017 domain-containing protein [uncultured Tessaracoccus sp.]|uniref:DUF3017 domain-containing protein n=1 Tax=uncultured Tessaracoccus sp. TaxID=905023 RepID=UPI002617B2DE|nr:DUF3017 domain-containing protein [uncultured Tessaracoccus sp.]
MADNDPLRDKPDKPAEDAPNNFWPLGICLLIVGVGIVFGFLGHWRKASMSVALAMGVAGALRSVLPRRVAGLLVVRRRVFDVLTYFGLAAAIAVVAFVVPPAR